MAGTPFTQDGAAELMRLGILTISISLGCAVVADIVQGIISGLINGVADAATDICFDHDGAVVLGIMFIVVSVLCRYGAELTQLAPGMQSENDHLVDLRANP